jgi:hypothetical protein
MVVAELKEATTAWDSMLGSSPHKAKVYSLIPFFMESALSKKYFVLRMEVYPKAELLKLETLTMFGVHTQYMPVNEMIPITRYDYWGASWKFWCKQNSILDLDMVYANRINKTMYLFDKGGEWHDDGVYSDALSLDKTYNEGKWYD